MSEIETEFLINIVCGIAGLVFMMFVFMLSANNKSEKSQNHIYKKLLDVDERLIILMVKDNLRTALENEDYKQAEECRKILDGYGKRRIQK